MKIFLIFFFLGLKICVAQTFSYPKFSKQGNTLEDLTPQNWKIIDTAYGDLNNDQIEDLAFVIEYYLPITEARAYGDNETEIVKEFQKPRVLAIYFKNKQSGYAFALQNNNFILRAKEGGSMGDPLKNINIINQNLQLYFEGGNNWRWKLNYEFKYQQKEWKLVLANNLYYHSESGEMTEKKYNFLEKKTYVATGNLFTREAAFNQTEEALSFNNLRTFTTFKKPWTWEITKDNFL